MNDSAVGLWQPPTAPYPGLRSFAEHESTIFRGRNRQIGAIVDLLRKYRFVVVTGASGCGKSSVVRAGVLAELYRGSIAGAGDVWIEAYFRPGTDPLGNLAASLVDKLVPPGHQEDLKAVRRLLGGPGALGEFRTRYENRLSLDAELDAAVAAAAAGGTTTEAETDAISALSQARRMHRDANLLIVADQFEEVFNDYNKGSAAAEELVARLLEVFRDEGLGQSGSEGAAARTYALVTMRSEYLGDCAAYRRMPDLLNRTAFLISRLDREELRAAAEEVVRRWRRLAKRQGAAAVLSFDAGLVDRLLDAAVLIKDDADHLPLFQHALARLWWLALDAQTDGAPPTTLIDAGHLRRALGLHSGADLDLIPADTLLARLLREHAEEVFQQLSDKERRLLEVMLRRMSSKDPAGNVVRRLATASDIAACAGCSVAEVDALVARLTAERQEFIQIRMTPGGGEPQLDLAHEAIIRKWKKFSGWVEDEYRAFRDFRALARRCRRILRDDDLVWARQWLQNTQIYRASPESLAAWAGRYRSQLETTFSGADPAAAVEELLDKSEAAARKEQKEHEAGIAKDAQAEAESARQREREARLQAEADKALADSKAAKSEATLNAARAQRWRFAVAGGAVLLLLLALLAYSTWLRLDQERQLKRLADLYAVAVANRDLPLGILPGNRREAVFQELAVLMASVDEALQGTSTENQRERLRTLEGEIDRVTREVLARNLEVEPTRDIPTAWKSVVVDCALRSQPGARRNIVSVQATASVAPLARLLGDERSKSTAFAILTKLDNRATIEMVHFGPPPFGPTFNLNGRLQSCWIGLEQTRVDVSSVDDLALSPSARWLLEWPAKADNGAEPTVKLRQLAWFQICLDPTQPAICPDRYRQWHVGQLNLGEFLGFQQRNQFPAIPAHMPSLMPSFQYGAFAEALAGQFERAADPSGKLDVSEPVHFETQPQQSWGNTLRWAKSVVLSSDARPGFLISAFASSGDLVAFVASTGAPTARLPADVSAPKPCDGRELCTHIVRVLHLDRVDKPSAKLSSIPIVDLKFVGPPIERIAFADGVSKGDLLMKFTGSGSIATLTWDRHVLKSWICAERVSKTQPAQDDFFTSAFRIFKRDAYADSSTTQQILEQACAAT